ncbi:hypothetical protein TRIP_D310051 [uncultured Paludibacter sp.]|uniref:Uncharacterized protein n=1 Tax=uncultured Paludibacter sp. TaxID=497635 RepID=A0A653ACC4_9BACT|nr:hypothetical protein TRIP_D310051 [uncultured Paludibacter sp.]
MNQIHTKFIYVLLLPLPFVIAQKVDAVTIIENIAALSKIFLSKLKLLFLPFKIK